MPLPRRLPRAVLPSRRGRSLGAAAGLSQGTVFPFQQWVPAAWEQVSSDGGEPLVICNVTSGDNTRDGNGVDTFLLHLTLVLQQVHVGRLLNARQIRWFGATFALSDALVFAHKLRNPSRRPCSVDLCISRQFPPVSSPHFEFHSYSCTDLSSILPKLKDTPELRGGSYLKVQCLQMALVNTN